MLMKSNEMINKQRELVLDMLIKQLQIVQKSGGSIAPKLLRLADDCLRAEQSSRVVDVAPKIFELARGKCRAAIVKARYEGRVMMSESDIQLLLNCLLSVSHALISGEGVLGEWLLFKW